MAAFRYVVVDVFTDRPLVGNQLAVFTDARDLPDEVLQPLAREVNLSERCCEHLGWPLLARARRNRALRINPIRLRRRWIL